MSKNPTMNPALRDFWRTRSRNKVLYGGRSSTKSWDAAAQAVRLSSHYSLKFLCIRQFQNNIKDSVYTLIKDQIYRFGVEAEYHITEKSITHKVTGSSFLFYGIARNIDEIKSTEAVDICWIEEAHNLTKAQWDIINPTIRKEHSEFWIIFNPKNVTDFVFQRFVVKPPKETVVRKINYDENPFLTEVMKKVIQEAKEEDYEEYEHIYEGKPREGDEKALFAFSDIERAMNGDTDGTNSTGVFSYAADVARYGTDKGCLSKRKGYRIYWMKSYAKYNTMEYANAIANEIDQESREPDAVFIDTIGVGAGVMDRTKERGYRAIEANVSMKADEIDVYYNKRAEMYFGLHEFIQKGGKIPNDPELKEELLAVRYFFNNSNGKIQIQPKDEIKELIGRSPDKGDSVALHFFSKVRPKSTVHDAGLPASGGGWMRG